MVEQHISVGEKSNGKLTRLEVEMRGLDAAQHEILIKKELKCVFVQERKKRPKIS